MPRYEAHLVRNWQTDGMTRVVIARTRDGGFLEAGVFLIDVFCLGVKDVTDEAELLARARAWSRGFLRAVRAWSAEWLNGLEHPDLVPHFGLIVATAEEREATTLVGPRTANRLAAKIGEALLAMTASFPSACGRIAS